MSLSRRRLLLVSAAAVSSVAALSSACAPAAPATPTGAPTVAAKPTTIAAPPTAAPTTASTTVATTGPPTVAPTIAPTLAPTPTTTLTLKIGVLVPYTESSIGVDIGLNQKRAADLYLKQHGGKLGGRTVNLVYSAESIEAGINKTKTKTLTDTEHVEVLIGGASSETAQVLRDAAEALKMVYIDTNGPANALSKSKYVFRTSASSWQLSEPLGEWAAKNVGGEFFVCTVDDIFGTESADAFVAGLTKNGGKATDRTTVSSGANWTKLIGSIKSQPTKHVFAAFYTDDAQGFLTAWEKQSAADAGYRLFGPGGLTDEEVLAAVKSAAVGVTTALFWSPDIDNPENKALVDAFPKEYVDSDTNQRVSLNGYAVPGWDAMAALDEALKQTGGSVANSDALIAALEGVSFKSSRGTFAFDKNTHNPTQDIYIRKVDTTPAGKVVNSIVAKVPNPVDIKTSFVS